MASIRWTVGARNDLRDIIAFISKDSATYAAATADYILLASERLRTYPKIGRMVPEFGDPAVREIIVGNYRLIYRLRRQQIGILAVVQGSRDLLRRLPKGAWDFG